MFEHDNDNMDDDIVEDMLPPALDPEEDDPLFQLETELKVELPIWVAELLRGINDPSQELENTSQSQQNDATEQCKCKHCMQSEHACNIKLLTQQMQALSASVQHP